MERIGKTVWTLILACAAGASAAQSGPYITGIPPETPQAREARHKEVTLRRSRIVIMVHRGASTFAPENTLEAYAAAIDHGADGVEIDIQKTKDGVLVLFHDENVDRMLAGSGKIRNLTYDELSSMPFHNPYGTANGDTRVPTLAAFLELARQRAMLIHLDVKVSGLQDELERLFDEADIWDHLVEVNAGNAERLRDHPKVTLIPYKGWLPGHVTEPDDEAVAPFLAQEGGMIFVKKDPGLVAKILGREPRLAVPLPDTVRRPVTE